MISRIRKLILTANVQQNTLKHKIPSVSLTTDDENSTNSVNSIRHSFATTEARTNQNTDPESQFPAEHIKTTNKSPQPTVSEISRLFQLKSRVPK